MEDQADATIYRVIMNTEEDKYRLVLPGGGLPSGWIDMELEGTRDECLYLLQQNWPALRPG